MKKALALLLAAVLNLLLAVGCTSVPAPEYYPIETQELRPVTPVGSVPEEFVPIVENNLFGDYSLASSTGILRTVATDEDNDRRTDVTDFFKYDKYGTELAHLRYPESDSHMLALKMHTSDGGFLFVDGFYSHALETGGWTSDAGIFSDVVKCDGKGNIEWTLTLQDCGEDSFSYGFEDENGYVFFGTRETPETKVSGVYSPTDAFIQLVSFSGEATKTVLYAGSDYDSISAVVPQSDGYLLYVYSQSRDGDFARDGEASSAAYWIFHLNDDLECVSKEMCSFEQYCAYFNRKPVGYLDEEAVFSDDARFADYDAGVVTAVLDYGTFYLVVSQNLKEELVPPYASSRRWYASETVYTAFSKNGNLLWRGAVDNPLPF